MRRILLLFFLILFVVMMIISVNALENAISKPGISQVAPGTSSIPDISVPYGGPAAVSSSKSPVIPDSNPQPITLYSNVSDSGDYVDHTVTIENANKTVPVWINIIAGPYGKFPLNPPDNRECHPGDCSGDTCCPVVSCSEKTCGATSCNTGDLSLPQNGGFKLEPGKSQEVIVKVLRDKGDLSGAGGLTVWARTGCVPTGEADYPLTCDSANCDMHYGIHSKVECGGIGSNTPATKAEITFNGWMSLDTYDISLVDGWNVPMTLEPVSGNYVPDPGNYKSCTCAGGNKDLFGPAQTDIPKMIKMKNSATAVSIFSACSYSQVVENNPNPMYCCMGDYSGSQCQQHLDDWPAGYRTAQFFQKQYPNAYSFAYSDARGGEHSCKPNDGNPINYKLTIYGEDHPSLLKETAESFYSQYGTPSTVSFEEDNIHMDVLSGISGYHNMHLEILDATISPEDPEDYTLSVSTLGHIYHLFSSIPNTQIDTVNLRISYSEEAYTKAGLKEESLIIRFFNPNTDSWEIVPGGVDTHQNVVSGSVPDLGFFTISGERDPVAEDSITFSPGWNFISISEPLLQGHNTAGIFQGIDTSGHSMLTFSPVDGWTTMKKDTILKPLEGYWIYATNTVQVPLYIDQNPVSTPLTKQLFEGWNSIGFSYTAPASARDTLLSVQDRWVYCIGYDAGVQKYDVPIINGGSEGYTDSRKMYPKQGYWLFMSDEGILAGLSVSNQ